MPHERLEVRARSEGTRLHLTTATGHEMTYEWDGPAGAHHAVFDEQRNNTPYGSELILQIWVYDVDGKYIGGVFQNEWS